MSDARPSHPALAAWTALRASGARAGALVTLVRADGGAARALGTRLAVSDDGRAFGAVTVGGCADGRAREAAVRVLQSGRSERLSLPLSEADAIALGLGCAGDVDLFIERVSLHANDAAARVLDAAVAASKQGEPSVMVTPIDGPAGRLLLRRDECIGTTGSAAHDRIGTELAGEVMRNEREQAGVREAGGVAWFVERIAPARTLVIVGATEVAAALCAFSIPLGWHVVLVDQRDNVLAESRFALAATRIAGLPAEVVRRQLEDIVSAAVVVVAHDYRVEVPVLRIALASRSPYVGMLGSRKRGATMRDMLMAEGAGAEEVARLRTPIGLAIGAEGAAEIAVSIVAELIATWRGAGTRP